LALLYPSRQTRTFSARPGSGLKNPYVRIEIAGHLQRSLSNLERVPLNKLRAFSRTVPVRKAIRRISNGVLAMPWVIQPPSELAKDEDALHYAEQLKKALLKPNRAEHNTYSKLIRAIITEMLVLGFAAVERQSGTEDTQPFWLWIANGAGIKVNSDWRPEIEGLVPRFYDCSCSLSGRDCTPLMSKDLFIVQSETNSYEYVPPSPLEIAYRLIEAWLGVGDYQSNTTSRAVRSYMLSVEGEDVSQDDVDAMRQYWETEVEQKGKVPIIGGVVKKTDLGAKNDEELYPKFTEYLLRMIALSFDLTTRDYNITEPDNRATAGIAADFTFADAILPMATTIEEHLDLEVIDFYAPGFHIALADTEPRTEKEEAEVAGDLFERKIITRNESRIRTGHEPVLNGDVFSDGTLLETEEDAENSSGINPVADVKRSPASKTKRTQQLKASQLSLFG
jgi:hypothetical protein